MNSVSQEKWDEGYCFYTAVLMNNMLLWLHHLYKWNTYGSKDGLTTCVGGRHIYIQYMLFPLTIFSLTGCLFAPGWKSLHHNYSAIYTDPTPLIATLAIYTQSECSIIDYRHPVVNSIVDYVELRLFEGSRILWLRSFPRAVQKGAGLIGLSAK